MNIEKAIAELDILRDFIDFINQQVGVYCDCLSGFDGNRVRIERQVPRVQRPTSRRIEDGQPVTVWTSLEDPRSPDIIHNRIMRSEEYIRSNSETGSNEQQICWSIIVFLFAHWDEKIRPEIASVRGVKPNEIQINALGDLRILRKAIVHNGGILTASDHRKMRVMQSLFSPNAAINPEHDEMHKIFVCIKQAIAELILHYTGNMPGAPKASELTDIAIQNAGRKRMRNPYGFWTATFTPKR